MIAFALAIITISSMTTLSFAFLRTSHRQRFISFSIRSLSPSFSSSSSEYSSILSPRLDGLDAPTVWHEFSPLAVENDAINLGQGFPDWDPPDFVLEALVKSTNPKFGRRANQYARSYAHMPLAEQLIIDYSDRFDHGISSGLDPSINVATAVGCTNVLYCALQGLLSPGDEVILLEPAFDIYMSQVKISGGVPVYVPLRPNNDTPDGAGASEVFQLDMNELEDSITEKTKVLLLNSPHNPTGKMFSRSEMESIADIIRRHQNIIVICDEVYEHIIFDKIAEPHLSFASLPGMFDRTLTLSSSGKTFSCTGWKVGWAIGPSRLIKAITAVQQWVNFSAPTPNQDAIAQCLQQARQPYKGFDTFYDHLANEYKRKRGLLVDALNSAGMKPIVPNGSFFIMADTSHVEFPSSYLDEVTEAMPTMPMPRDWALSRWLTKEVKVTAIPPSAFYDKHTVHLAKNLLRFAFCKGDETIIEAHRRLEEYFS